MWFKLIHCCIFEKLAKRLKQQGPPTAPNVRGNNSQHTLLNQIAKLKLTPVHSDDSRATFSIKPYVTKGLKVGTDIIDVTKLKQQYPHLESDAFSKYSYADVGMILGRDAFHLFHPLEYFKSDHQDTLVPVRLPLGWMLSGPLLWTSGLAST